MVKRQAFSKQNKRRNANNSGEYSVLPMITRSLNVGMPYKMQTKLRFVQSYQVAHAGATQKYLWMCNTASAPSLSLSPTETSQYWDVLNDVYTRSYVVKSRCTVTVTNISIAGALECALSTDDNSGSTSSSMLDISSRVGARSAQLGHYSGGNAMAKFSHTFTPNTMLGVPPTDAANVAIGLSSPPNQYYWLVAILSTGGTSGNVGIHVDIEYDVVFEELRAQE